MIPCVKFCSRLELTILELNTFVELENPKQTGFTRHMSTLLGPSMRPMCLIRRMPIICNNVFHHSTTCATTSFTICNKRSLMTLRIVEYVIE